jgi:transcriptional regulator with XRE-family HTH domain
MGVAPEQRASDDSDQEPTSVGTLLRAYRLRAGLTQEALAEQAGLSARGVQDIERGVRRAPQPVTLALLIAALRLSADEQARLQEAVVRRRMPRHPSTLSRRTLQPPPHILPAPLTSFIGREQELVALTHHLDETHLLTLTGAGGTGKTRLAVQVATAVLEAFPDGVFFVNLAPLSSPALVLPTIAQTLGVVEQAAEPLIQTLKGRLRGTRTLLVLDNFEHVVAAAAQVSTLLEAAAGLTVLATSRVPLRVQGEREYPVPPWLCPTHTICPRSTRSRSMRLSGCSSRGRRT